MTLQSSGNPISFSQIVNEFGQPNGKNLGAYRVSENIGALTNMPLDTGVPQSGQIAFSDFYGKQLNTVVNFYDGRNETRQTARTKYDNKSVRVIGNFKQRPTSSSGTRVIIHVNKTISSTKGNRNYVALKTGGWDSNTNLDLINNGNIYGSGGNGGKGGTRRRRAGDGEDGSSGLGVSYPIQLWNYGSIRGGGGGGGGGRSGRRDERDRYRCGPWCEGRRRDRRRTGGGGGGGGQGSPGGSGGDGGGGEGGPGGGGSIGGPGRGGSKSDDSAPGAGGGSWGSSGGSQSGSGGNGGRAILISGSGSVTYEATGTLSGGSANEGFS
jgi:hypothetical protein